MIRNRIFNGSDILRAYMDYEECAELCDELDGCLSFLWFVQGNRYECYLKSEVIYPLKVKTNSHDQIRSLFFIKSI